MTFGGEPARVWPSAAALEQGLGRALKQSPRGFLAEPLYFTWDNFLPSVLDQVPLPPGLQALLPLAGPMLVRQIIFENLENPAWTMYSGQASGRRLPRRLWRLLVEIKSAGLGPADLAGMKGPRIRAVGLLLAEYNKRLKELCLLDQADCLAILEDGIQRGRVPGRLGMWHGVEAKDVLWLRTMDLRLLLALGRIMPVRLEFALGAPPSDPGGVFKLLEATARVLERDPGERIQILWRGDEDKGLGRMVEAMLAGETPPRDAGHGPELEVLLAPGRYGEVSSLVGKAMELLERGEAANEIVIAFPDLEIYGQMCLDLARRTGLPLELGQDRGLASSPLVDWFISLLELPSVHFSRKELSKVLGSPFCGLLPLAGREDHAFGIWNPEGLERRLRQTGYIDSRESQIGELAIGGRGNSSPDSQNLAAIHGITKKIAQLTINLYGKNDFKRFLESIGSLLGELEPGAMVRAGSSAENRGEKCAAELARASVFDLMAHKELIRCVDEALKAARQVDASEPVSFRRGMALFKDALSQSRLPRGRAPLKGVKVTSIEQAAGLKAGHILVGGLALGEFPRRPGGGDLLTGRDRMELGRRAGLPVWRTDEEEYGGQVLGLALVMGQAAKTLTFSAPVSDSDGSPKELIHIIKKLTNYLTIEVKKKPGGAFGGQHDLALARDSQGLWAGLSAQLLQPANNRDNDDSSLGQAALFEICRRDSFRRDWLGICRRVLEENSRLELDEMTPEQRHQRADSFSGRLARPEALGILDGALGGAAVRRLSPSSLESLAACPAAWFWSRLMGLGAAPQPEWDLERREEGNWVHAALRIFFDPEKFRETPPPDMEAEINNCLARARELLIEQGAGAHAAAWEARQKVLAASLSRLALREYQDLEGMRPHAVEASFGREGDELVLELLARPEKSLCLTGRVDRIDLGPGRVRITDYKHGTNATNLGKMAKEELFGQSAFQLPVYLAAAGNLLGKAYDGQHLSARILPTILLGMKPPCAEMEPDSLFLARDPDTRRKALADGQPNLFNAIEALWLGVLEGNFSANPQKAYCEHCDVRHVCRAEAAPGAGLWDEVDS